MRIAALLFTMACAPVGQGDGVLDPDEIPDVGWFADLQEYHHDVGGRATIVDESTIEITDFTYDGKGINSRFFLLIDGEKFRDDYELTDNLVRSDPYEGETLTLDLPSHARFDDFNLLTLWCVPAGANFGDGVFQPPAE